MGLLDDAIREHLELKRRHGADPSEVERQEQEALGPARRGAAPTADAELDSGAGSVGTLDDDEPDALYDDELEDDYEDDLPAASVPAAEPEAPVVPPAREEPEDRFAVGREPHDEPEVVEDRAPAPRTEPPPPEPEPVDPPPPPARERHEDEVASEGEGAEDDAPESEDVLEETPEFLQETPEHDRLWFEQKPPRDFDF